MALSQQARSTIDEFLVPNIGEEAANEMLRNFPTEDESPPASEDFVRAEFAALRAAIAGHDGRITSLEERVASLDDRMISLEERMISLERRMTDGFADIRVALSDGFARQVRFLMTTFVAMLAVLVAAIAVFR